MLTNSGALASNQMTMYREKVRTIGISLLGGNSGSSGPYELGIDSIRAVNEEHVTKPSSALLSSANFSYSSCTFYSERVEKETVSSAILLAFVAIDMLLAFSDNTLSGH